MTTPQMATQEQHVALQEELAAARSELTQKSRQLEIEAALEKVRAKTMGMQKSDELWDVVKLLFQQVKALDSAIWRGGFSEWQQDAKYFTQWITDATGELSGPYTINVGSLPMFEAVKQARQKGETFFTWVLDGEQMATMNKLLTSYADKGELNESLSSDAVLTALKVHHFVIGPQVVLFFITHEQCPDTWDIFKRFGTVFQQTYTRFLDLQKAEQLARDVVKQASLNRIRSQIAGMRSATDLQHITQFIWEELSKLNVNFRRCGIFIMDEAASTTLAYLSTPGQQPKRALQLPFDMDDLTIQTVEHWRKGQVYHHYWGSDDFKAWIKKLVDMGQVESVERFLGGMAPPKSICLHFVPFTQGMLYVGSPEILSDYEMDSLQATAEAFSIAYGRYEDFSNLEKAKQKVEEALLELKSAQAQLIQAEKMASLGELTAGIAHEIQNPLNFVNNFSDINKELTAELKTAIDDKNYAEVRLLADYIEQNEEKIRHHGRRADSIVKGMLQHSRASKGSKEPTDINALADEYLRLSYQGLRAKDPMFNASLKTHFDPSIGKVAVIAQDIGRVLLNLFNNAFYAVNEKRAQQLTGFAPTVSVKTTRANDPQSGEKNGVEIRITDNGSGIAPNILDKIFQPFFTTKPTGQGTGLGLSLSYDIIKAHGGEIKAITPEGGGTEFVIWLPA